MARRIPERRFDDLVEAATEVFIAHGYRLTQMSDVAEAVGVAKGTLYGYVESKEALFWLCLAQAGRLAPVERPAELPVPTPPTGAVAAMLKERLASESVPPALRAAAERDRAEDPRAELEDVVRALYDLLERYCRAIKLIDRCVDHPELREVWQAMGRESPRAALVRYLAKRMASGQLRRVAHVNLAARMVVEVATTWAVHIKWDRVPESFDPADARENAVDFLVAALMPRGA